MPRAGLVPLVYDLVVMEAQIPGDLGYVGLCQRAMRESRRSKKSENCRSRKMMSRIGRNNVHAAGIPECRPNDTSKERSELSQ